MKRWQILKCESREKYWENNPTFFLVISPDAYLENSLRVVCIPIYESTDETAFSIKLGMENLFANATEFYTLDKSLLTKTNIVLESETIMAVENSVREYLQLL